MRFDPPHARRRRRRLLLLSTSLATFAVVARFVGPAAEADDFAAQPVETVARAGAESTSDVSAPSDDSMGGELLEAEARLTLWALIDRPAGADRIEREVAAPTRAFAYVAVDRDRITAKDSPFWQPGRGRFALPLPDGRTVEVLIERTETQGPDQFTSEGRVEGFPGSRFLWSYVRGSVAVSVEGVAAGEVKVRTIAADEGPALQLYVVDATLSGDCGAGPASQMDRLHLAGIGTGTTLALESPALSSGDAVIDLLMVYTSAVRAAYGSTDHVLADIGLAVSKVNSDFAGSGITARIRLADTMEVAYPGDEITTSLSGWQDTTLQRLAGVTDGFMDAVHARRDAVGADMVSLVQRRSDPSSSGIAYVMEELGDFREPHYAFSVVNQATFSDGTTLTHEIGHTLGCAHDHTSYHGSTPDRGYHGAFAHSYGVHASGSDAQGVTRNVRSIMAYAMSAAGSSSVRVRYFSSPSVQIASYSAGGQTYTFPTPITLGSESADNVRTIERTAFQVSNYRLSTDRSGAGRLVNVSTRAHVSTGYRNLTGGFVVEGDEAGTLLLRATGPALAVAPFDVADTLPDPVLRVHRIGGGLAGENHNWHLPAENGLSVAAAAQAVGAFPLPNGSRDAAIMVDLAAGAYTAEVSTGDGTEGYALVEAYRVAGADATRLVNLSTRAYAEVEKPIVAGFVVQPDPDRPYARKTMFIRVRGPSLAQYGLPAEVVMPDPAFELYDAEAQLIYLNDDWDSPSADLDGTARDNIPLLRRGTVDQASEAAVHAAALRVGSADMLPPEPAAVLELPAGLYTLIVRPFAATAGAPSQPGVAIVEVFELEP